MGLCLTEPYEIGFDCNTEYKSSLFDCDNQCDENVQGAYAYLTEGAEIELAPDSRCIFKVNFHDKGDTSEKRLVIDDSFLVEMTSQPPKAGRGRRQLQDNSAWLAYIDCGNEAYDNGQDVY